MAVAADMDVQAPGAARFVRYNAALGAMEMADSQVFEIILIAAIAVAVLFRLYTVLGRRTGNERAPDEYRVSDRQSEPAVYAPEGRDAPLARAVERPSDPVLSGVFDISLADRNFDKEKFLGGARGAYETIEGAFAAGDVRTLRPLLSESVFAAFSGAIDARRAAGKSCAFTFIGYKEVRIVAAELKNTLAQISVRFDAQFISVTHDAAGTVIEGDDKTVQHVCDVWTFERDTRARNPNWILTATSSADQ